MAAALVAASCGCMSFLHPVDKSALETAGFCKDLPDYARSHVYVFLVHGLDPFDYADLRGLRDHLHDLGFNKVYYGQLYHTVSFEREVQRIHREEPDARFVVIGFSLGASMARAIALDAQAQGIPIDLVVYLSGTALFEGDRDRPSNVLRVVNILPRVQWNSDSFPEEIETIRESGIWHFAVPTHAQTLETLAHEIAAVAGAVPVPEFGPPSAPPGPDAEPTPRKVQGRAPGRADDWDFLKPVSRLKSLPDADKPPAGATDKVPTDKPPVRPNLISSLW
jgi:hypothetical protein